jgi:uncharacterized membrane protein (DUF106 family)
MFNDMLYFYIKFLDSFLYPLLQLKPIIAIFTVSLALSLISLGISILTINKVALRKIKENMSYLQSNLKVAQKELNIEVLGKSIEEMVKLYIQSLRIKIKSIAITLLLVIIIFPWLNHHFSEIKVVAELPFSLPIIGSSMDWIIWYIFVSLTTTYLIQKILGIDYV